MKRETQLRMAPETVLHGEPHSSVLAAASQGACFRPPHKQGDAVVQALDATQTPMLSFRNTFLIRVENEMAWVRRAQTLCELLYLRLLRMFVGRHKKKKRLPQPALTTPLLEDEGSPP